MCAISLCLFIGPLAQTSKGGDCAGSTSLNQVSSCLTFLFGAESQAARSALIVCSLNAGNFVISRCSLVLLLKTQLLRIKRGLRIKQGNSKIISLYAHFIQNNMPL